MTYLLDVNILIALIDPVHLQHSLAHEWFEAKGKKSWATCPITENAVLRIVGNPRYPNSPGTPAAVAPVLLGLRERRGHVFWSDDVSLLDTNVTNSERLLSAGQITDSYLLALARHHGGQLATFDQRLIVDAVHHGARSLHRIV